MRSRWNYVDVDDSISVNRTDADLRLIVYTVTHPKTNMTMENQPFEDVSPIANGDFPLSC